VGCLKQLLVLFNLLCLKLFLDPFWVYPLPVYACWGDEHETNADSATNSPPASKAMPSHFLSTMNITSPRINVLNHVSKCF
jgi:hypothetical protein